MSNKALYKAGISQEERKPANLTTSLPAIDGRTRKDIYQFLYNYAQQISYYDLDNNKSGTWVDFIPKLPTAEEEVVFADIVSYWKKLGLSEEISQRPHLSLTLVFIELFELLKGELNLLSRKHLDYYYKQVLQTETRKHQSDQVFIQFKINEELNEHLLKKGTQLSAGEDILGKTRIYTLDEDVSLNQTTIGSIYTLLVDCQNEEELVYQSMIQNVIPEDSKSSENTANFWSPFGESQYSKSDTKKTMAIADLGWYIASSTLSMQGGVRTVTTILDFGPDKLGDLTDGSVPFLQSKITAALKLLQNGDSDVKTALNDAKTAVETSNFVEASLQLQAALGKVSSLGASDTKKIEDAIKAAKTEVDREFTSLEKINAAIDLLKNEDSSAVKTALVEAKTNVTNETDASFEIASLKLQDALGKVSNLGTSYTESEKEAIEDAIKAAKTEVDRVLLPLQKITTAIALLQIGDTSETRTALIEAKTNTVKSDFTAASSTLQKAITLDLGSLYTKEAKTAIVAAITAAITEVNKVKDPLEDRFSVSFSGETSWIPVDTTNIIANKVVDVYEKLQLTITLKETQPAVVSYNGVIDTSPLTTDLPCMKVLLKQTSHENIYTKLKALALNSISLNVSVANLTNLHLFSDLSDLDHEKPFYPFEADQKIGDHFYIGCKEIFQKSTDTVILNMKWQQVPEKLEDYYKEYYGVLILPAQKKIREAVALLQHGTETQLLATTLKNAATALSTLNLITASSELDAALRIDYAGGVEDKIIDEINKAKELLPKEDNSGVGDTLSKAETYVRQSNFTIASSTLQTALSEAQKSSLTAVIKASITAIKLDVDTAATSLPKVREAIAAAKMTVDKLQICIRIRDAVTLLKVNDNSAVKTALNDAKTATIASNFVTASTALQTAIDEVSNLGSSYTNDEKTAITTAITAAKTAVDESIMPLLKIEIAKALLKVNDNSAVKTALGNAETAVETSNFVEASTELQNALGNVQKLDSSYTQDEEEVIKAAITAAKIVVDNLISLSQKIRIAIALLKADDNSTVKEELNSAKIDAIATNFATASTKLQTAIDKVSNLGSYNNDEKTAITTAITAAKTVADGMTTTAQTVATGNEVTQELHFIANDHFKANVYILNQGIWKATKEEEAISLFNKTDAQKINTTQFSFPKTLEALTPAQQKELDTSSFTLNSRNGFLRLTLSNPVIEKELQPFSAFGHQEYTDLLIEITENNTDILSEKIIAENQQAVAEAHGQAAPFIGPEIPQMPLPKEPYEPVLNQFSLSYTAQESISLNANATSESKCYQIGPFGHKVLNQSEILLPQYTLIDDNKNNVGGNLYIGLKDLSVGQSISLLVKMTEGYVNTTSSISGTTVHWSYLAKDRWVDFQEKKELLYDGTEEFTKSGLVVIALPEDAHNVNHNLMPSGLKWIRIKTSRNTKEIEKIMSIIPQAGRATFTNRENDLSHLASSLPGESIEGLVNEDSNIDQIIQVYPSFGGRCTEGDFDYYTRMSERLRHKNRAITAWDYERLVLEKFPQIDRVKCFRNKEQDSTDSVRLIPNPGHITLVVVPKITNYQTDNRYQPPKANQEILLEIEKYLKSKTSPHSIIKVTNPHYETLQINCEVGFINQLRVGEYKKQLNDDLKKLLSPWASDDKKSVTFSNVLYRSEILLYVERRPYIKYVNKLSITRTIDEGNEIISSGIPNMIIVSAPTGGKNDFRVSGIFTSTDQPIIRVKSEKSIFVTADTHDIEEHQVNIIPEEPKGVNYWEVETELIVI